jgi:hypothetical protein
VLFQKSRPKVPMHFDAAVDDVGGDRIQVG